MRINLCKSIMWIVIYLCTTIHMYSSNFVESTAHNFIQKINSYIPLNNNSQQFDIKNISNLKDVTPVVILGSGPAGLSAALFIARANIQSIIITGNDIPHCQLLHTDSIRNWPGVNDIKTDTLMNIIENQVTSAAKGSTSFIHDNVEEVNFNTWPFIIKIKNGTILRTLSVIIATGASPISLPIPGEEFFCGKGLKSSKTSCQLNSFKDKNVVVVGGGDSAIAQVFKLMKIAKNITILVRGNAMRAEASDLETIKKASNITILYNKQITQINGEQYVTSIDIQDTKTNILENIPADGVFLAIGVKPNSELFTQYLQLDKNGYLMMQARGQETSKKGIFAAGTVQDSLYNKAAVASAEGIKAALDCIAFLKETKFVTKKQKTKVR